MCITTIWLVSWYHGDIGSYTGTHYYWGHLLVIWHSQLSGLFWPFKGNIWSSKYCNKHGKYHDDLFNMWPPETNYLFTTSCTTGQKPWLCSIKKKNQCVLSVLFKRVLYPLKNLMVSPLSYFVSRKFLLCREKMCSEYALICLQI